jgi:hypothetical protein
MCKVVPHAQEMPMTAPAVAVYSTRNLDMMQKDLRDHVGRPDTSSAQSVPGGVYVTHKEAVKKWSKAGGWTPVPDALLKNVELKPAMGLILAWMMRKCGDCGWTGVITYPKLAKQLGMSKSSVQRNVKTLEKLGYLAEFDWGGTKRWMVTREGWDLTFADDQRPAAQTGTGQDGTDHAKLSATVPKRDDASQNDQSIYRDGVGDKEERGGEGQAPPPHPSSPHVSPCETRESPARSAQRAETAPTASPQAPKPLDHGPDFQARVKIIDKAITLDEQQANEQAHLDKFKFHDRIRPWKETYAEITGASATVDDDLAPGTEYWRPCDYILEIQALCADVLQSVKQVINFGHGRGRTLTLLGMQGTGKSSVLSAIVACARNMLGIRSASEGSVRVLRWPLILDPTVGLNAPREGKIGKVYHNVDAEKVQAMKTASLLAIDDLFAGEVGTGWREDDERFIGTVREIIRYRADQVLPTIITSNRSCSELAKVLDPRSHEASTVDRLFVNGHVVEIIAASLRGRSTPSAENRRRDAPRDTRLARAVTFDHEATLEYIEFGPQCLAQPYCLDDRRWPLLEPEHDSPEDWAKLYLTFVNKVRASGQSQYTGQPLKPVMPDVDAALQLRRRLVEMLEHHLRNNAEKRGLQHDDVAGARDNVVNAGLKHFRTLLQERQPTTLRHEVVAAQPADLWDMNIVVDRWMRAEWNHAVERLQKDGAGSGSGSPPAAGHGDVIASLPVTGQPTGQDQDCPTHTVAEEACRPQLLSWRNRKRDGTRIPKTWYP